MDASRISPSDIGLDKNSLARCYAFCYCEENVLRAINLIRSQRNEMIETFAVFISSYQGVPQSCFPGSWLPVSRVLLVVDPRAKKAKERTCQWDYHVICVLRIQNPEKNPGKTDEKNGAGDDDSKVDKAQPASTADRAGRLFVADFDSALCNGGNKGQIKNLVPFAEYCRTTFAQSDRCTIKFRVVPGDRFVDTFSSTRAHMLPLPLLRQWLSDPARRTVAPPGQMLNMPPHADDPILPDQQKKRVDLVHFINMHPESPTAAFSVSLSLQEFVDEQF